MGPFRLNNGTSGLLGASAPVRYAGRAVRLEAEEGWSPSSFLNAGVVDAPQDELQAWRSCAEQPRGGGKGDAFVSTRNVCAGRKASESGSWAGKREGSLSSALLSKECFE